MKAQAPGPLERVAGWLIGRDAAPESVYGLVLANAIPLIGVLLLRWNLATILVLYWVESGIVGLLNVPKILLARGPLRASAGRVTIEVPVDATWVTGVPGRILTSAFFLVHYGIFWIGHGFIVVLLAVAAPQRANLLAPLDLTEALAAAGVEPGLIGSTALVVLASHGYSFWANFVRRREYLGISPIAQSSKPYARVVVMHLTILGGGWLMILAATPFVFLVVMVIVKTVIDVRLHLREHRLAQQRSGLATPHDMDPR